MDLSDTVLATSDQIDAVDLAATGPKTYTITKVSANNGDQPVNIHLAESAKVWRPGKSMRRVLVACWGADASVYVGRRVTLYCDPTVTFGKEATGGTRVSHLSHIDKPMSVPLLITRGKSALFRVQPMSRQDWLRAEWATADPERRKVIEAEVAALQGNGEPGDGA